MKRMILSSAALAAALALCAAAPAETGATAASAPPHLEKNGQSINLVVNGKPFLAVSDELNGSSSSSAEYMETIWPKLKEANVNNVLTIVSWEQIEPREGEFDFTVIDDLLKGARASGLKLTIVWFASWKNGVTTHIPMWAQVDQKRFPLVQNEKGETYSTLSTVYENSWKADAKAFAAMMKYIAQVDSKEQTIIMVQVENEMGVRGMVRDYCPKADKLYNSQVPAGLMNYLVTNKSKLIPETLSAWANSNYATRGTWSEVFGKNERSEEIFMAWNYANYVNHIVEAGKKEYNIPMFVNAWIVQPTDVHPGDYPSGGPQAQNHDIWRAGAPSLDMLCPDIYLPDFPGILNMYTRSGNPGFVPESRFRINGAANAAYAIGQNGAIGYTYTREPKDYDEPTADLFKIIREANDVIVDHRAKGTIHAIWLPKDGEQDLTLGSYTLKFSMKGFWAGDNPFKKKSAAEPEQDGPVLQGGAEGYAIVMEEGDGDYTIIGSGPTMIIVDASGKKLTGLGEVREGRYEAGRWVPLRWLNGDQTNVTGDIVDAHKRGFTGQGVFFMSTAPVIVKVKAFKIN